MEEIGRQLEGRARLCRGLGIEAIADELDRMRTVEVAPVLDILGREIKIRILSEQHDG